MKDAKRLWLTMLFILVTAVGVGLTLRDQLQRHVKQTQSAMKHQQLPSKREPKIEPAKPQESQSVKRLEVNKAPAIDQYLNLLNFSGTALIVKNQHVVLNKGYGLANLQKKLSNTATTRYLIGSAEKAFVATAILQLVDQGRLKLDDSISKTISDFPNGQTITVRQLLNHTSGITGRQQTNVVTTPQAMLAEIERNGIQREPGVWHYLDANYIVLANVISKVGHQNLHQYLQQHVIKPLGLTSTGFYNDNEVQDPSFSTGYKIVNRQLQVPPKPEFSQLYGVGDMFMSTWDMYQFDRAISRHQLFSQAGYDEMIRPGSASHYGMGFYNDPGLIVSHGVVDGWNVSNGFTHDGNTFIVLFSNIQNNIASFGRVNQEILNRLSTIQ